MDSPGDVAAARERIHEATMAAEGPLHDLGAISIVNSDSQGMGRIGETVRRTFQLADAMKAWRATEAGDGWPGADDGADDNARVLRYLAKVTVEPARVHGLEAEVGSLSPGRLADVVLWRPAAFGVRPEIVLKSGYWAWGALGEGNASVEGAQPVRYRPHWGALGSAAAALGTTFVSTAALDAGFARRLGTRRRVVAVRDTRAVRRGGLVHNTAAPNIGVDRADGTVTLAGRVLAAPPATDLPLNRRYLLG
jgi:urease subunit alpha